MNRGLVPFEDPADSNYGDLMGAMGGVEWHRRPPVRAKRVTLRLAMGVVALMLVGGIVLLVASL